MSKKKKYFVVNKSGVSTVSEHVIIVRSIQDKKIVSDGPYHSKEEASKKCIEILLCGLCSWEVHFDGVSQ